MIVVRFFLYFIDYEICKYSFSNTFDWEMLQNAVPRLNLYSNPLPVWAGNSFFFSWFDDLTVFRSCPRQVGVVISVLTPEVLLQLMIIVEIHSPRTSSLPLSL